MEYEKQFESALIVPGLQEQCCAELHDSNSMGLSRTLYYAAKPLLPNSIRLLLRRKFAEIQKKKYTLVWPIYAPAAAQPAGWAGWPAGKRFALLLTHDVDTSWGNENLPRLIELEQSLGFTSTVFFVPERYKHPDKHHELLRRNGFEIAVHGLKHDGKLYQSEKTFKQNAERINDYISRWGAAGFRAPCMHHNLDWHHRLNILYDASTYDTDPFEPQGGGAGTIFPFRVTDKATGRSYIELPYTLPQDYLLYIIMQLKTVNLWKRKLDWVAAMGGMVHFISHPDYMSFKDNGCIAEKYPALFYRELLTYIKETYADQYWAASAKEMAEFWRARQG